MSEIVKRRPLPVGTILSFAASTAPRGWLFCYGQNVSRSTYIALFAVLGTTFGTGDGSTTFGIPDLRGRVIAGLDNMGGTSANRLTDAVTGGLNGDTLGDTGGEESHTPALAEMYGHSHNTYGNQQTNTAATGAANRIIKLTNSGGNNSGTTNTVGGGNAFNVVQPTIILPYIIFAG